MTTVRAIYQNGVFRPLVPVVVPENEIVEIAIQPAANAAPDWVLRLREVRERIGAGKPLFPDSSLEIAEDRKR
jgi:predicted DNA-binding antitoxin AbrB/MazE fold protein